MKLHWYSTGWLALIFIGVALVVGSKPARAQRPLGIDVSSYQGSADSPPVDH
jgi:hypothetical protein